MPGLDFFCENNLLSKLRGGLHKKPCYFGSAIPTHVGQGLYVCLQKGRHLQKRPCGSFSSSVCSLSLAFGHPVYIFFTLLGCWIDLAQSYCNFCRFNCIYHNVLGNVNRMLTFVDRKACRVCAKGMGLNVRARAGLNKFPWVGEACPVLTFKTQNSRVLTKSFRTRRLRSSKHQNQQRSNGFASAVNQFSLTFVTCQELTYTVFINPLVLCLSVAGPGRVSRLPGLGPPLVRILFGRNPFATRAVPRQATCPENLVRQLSGNRLVRLAQIFWPMVTYGSFYKHRAACELIWINLEEGIEFVCSGLLLNHFMAQLQLCRYASDWLDWIESCVFEFLQWHDMIPAILFSKKAINRHNTSGHGTREGAKREDAWGDFYSGSSGGGVRRQSDTCCFGGTDGMGMECTGWRGGKRAKAYRTHTITMELFFLLLKMFS